MRMLAVQLDDEHVRMTWEVDPAIPEYMAGGTTDIIGKHLRLMDGK